MSSFVNKPDRFSQDAIIPGRREDPRGFIDVNRTIDSRNPFRVYLSVTGLHQLAQRHRQIGLSPTEELDSAREANAQLAHALAEAVAERDQAVETVEGFKRALQQMGLKEPAPRGRPPKKADEKSGE